MSAMRGILLLMERLLMLLMSALVALSFGCEGPRTSRQKDYTQCLSCHTGIEEMGEQHDFPCASCHLLPSDRVVTQLQDHHRIIRNPSDPLHVRTFCMSCHEEEVRRLEGTLHSTMAGIINQTRYLWGAQTRAVPAIYGLSGSLAPIPAPNTHLYPDSPPLLVDDFLRRRCLRCHIHTRDSGGHGLYRATGCAACHVPYEDDGLYRGKDPAIDRSQSGYPAIHRLTAKIPNRQCNHCHNQNRVGADYEGRFEHDYHLTYRTSIKGGKAPPSIYGADHHRLAQDIHAERGLWCIDCHGKQDVMGDGETYSYQMEVPKRRCADCHGGFGGTVSGAGPFQLAGDGSGGPSLISKGSGRKHAIPTFSGDSSGHRITAHRNVRCSACHSQWSYQDYGLSVIREDILEGDKWSALTVQGDPASQRVLERHLERAETSYPASQDWISGEARQGVWSIGWRFRRWEWAVLGMDHEARYAVLRPLYQYLISYVDRTGNVALDNVQPLRGDGSGKGWAFMPYVPHTTSPRGKACERCHGNRMAVGLGIDAEPTSDTLLILPSPPAVSDMSLLGTEARDRLLSPSETWRRARLKTYLPQAGKGR